MLESFGIMDYSLLLGIHNLEKDRNNNIAIEAYYEAKIGDLHTISENGNQLTNNSVGISNNNNNNNNKSTLSSTKNWDNVFNM